jgi:hypothetical protein
MHQILRELAVKLNARSLTIDDAMVNEELSKNFPCNHSKVVFR